ncbi:MAG TPA: hypothetical protein PK297_01645, partial [Spirochaetota bacterium]|nr:hypothetical protein [Spirochaetota bacterium]
MTLQSCRQCGACCIAPSISSLDKPAGVRCHHLTDRNTCSIFGSTNRPAVCSSYAPGTDCGHSFLEAMEKLTRLETLTSPVRTDDPLNYPGGQASWPTLTGNP